jgi:hypothetical protein
MGRLWERRLFRSHLNNLTFDHRPGLVQRSRNGRCSRSLWPHYIADPPPGRGVVTKLKQLFSQRFRLFCRDAAFAMAQRTFPRVQDGLEFFQRRQVGAAPEEADRLGQVDGVVAPFLPGFSRADIPQLLLPSLSRYVD